jgi:hypothetical protein
VLDAEMPRAADLAKWGCRHVALLIARDGTIKMARTGRPSSYSRKIADEICEAIATGGALHRLCEEREGWPNERTVYRWLEANEEFRRKYARARDRQGDRMAFETVLIADEEPDPVKARLRVDARKWLASKLAPKKYGDRQQLEHTGKDGGPIQHMDLSALSDDELNALEAMRAKIGAVASEPGGDQG